MAWATITLIFPPSTPFPMPSHSDLGVTRYSHTRHYARLADGCWRATYTRDELAWALEVAAAITHNEQ